MAGDAQGWIKRAGSAGEDDGLPVELRDLYAQALLSADRCLESEPLIWQMFEQNPARMHQVVNLIGKMIDSELDAEAVELARKLEAFQRRRGERRMRRASGRRAAAAAADPPSDCKSRRGMFVLQEHERANDILYAV